MKKCNTLWGAYLLLKVHICDAEIAYLDDIANLEILPCGLHFSIIKDVEPVFVVIAILT